MKITSLLLYLTIISSSSAVQAQKQVLKELLPGEEVPDIKLKMINYSKPELHLSELKGKLVILDFWSTWCSVCLKQFPILTELQEQNKKDVFILPVGFDANEKGSISNFITKRKGTQQQINLPVALQEKKDTTLMKLFPFYGLPHEVWIDKNGKLLAVTDHKEVTKKNIEKVLNEKNTSLTEKKYDKDFDRAKPLFVNGNGGTGNKMISRSLFTPYLNGIESLGFKHSRDSSMTRLFITNASILLLYKLAYQNLDTSTKKNLEFDVLNKRFLIESKQSSIFKILPRDGHLTGDEIENFKRDHLVSYELILPPSFSLQEAYKIMLEDLNRLYHLNSAIEKRKVKCLSLTYTSPSHSTESNEDNKDTYQLINSKDSIIFKNISLSLVTRYLNMYYPIPFIVDETNYTSKVDIELSSKNQSLPALREALIKYDLALTETEKELDMIVLRDSGDRAND